MRKRKVNATKSGLIIAIIYIIVTSILISGVGVLFFIEDYRHDAEFLQNLYTSNVIDFLKEKVNDAALYIDTQRETEMERLKNHTVAQVERVYNIFLDMYLVDKADLKTIDDVKKDLINLARAYYHKIRGECLFIFNKNGNMIFNVTKADLIKKLFKKHMVKNGFVRITYKGMKRLIYIKRFEPTGWYLAYCSNITEAENKLKGKITAYLNKYRYGYKKHGYVFVSVLLNKNGGACFAKSIVNPNRPKLVGHCLSDNVTDIKGNYFRKKYLNDVITKGYSVVEYYYKIPGTNKVGKKIAYIMLYKPWNWLIGTGLYVKDFREQFQKEKKEEVWKTGEIVLLVVLGMIGFSVVVFIIFGRRAKEDINKISEFLDKFPSVKSMDLGKLMFEETSRVAEKINGMAEKIVKLTEQQNRMIARYTSLANFMKSCVVIVKKVEDSIIIEDINSCVQRCMGIDDRNKIIGKSVKELFKGLPAFIKRFEMVFESNIDVESMDIVKNVRNCGYTRYFSSEVFKIRDDEAVLIADDVTDSVLLYFKSEVERDRLDSLINSINVGVCIANYEGRVVFSNNRLKRIFEVENQNINSIFDIFIEEKARVEFQNYFNSVIQDALKCEDCIFEIQTFKGNKRWAEVTASKDTIGNEPVVIVSVKDVTDRYLKEKEIEYISLHDDLTGVYNRRFFKEELARLFHKRNYPLALVMFDINGLKMVNDILGHNWGDWLIKRIADIIKDSVRGVDLVARIGGDEFVLLIPNVDSKGVEICKSRIIENIEKENQKKGQPYISVSIGYAIQEGQFKSPDELLSAADRDMYKNKFGNHRKEELMKVWNSLKEMAPEALDEHEIETFLKR